MKPTDSRLRIPRLGKGLIAAVAAFCLLLTVTATALAASVGVSDAAGVLNVSQVKNSVPSIRYSVNVYTTNTFSGDKGAFVQQAQSHLNSNLIVVAISTNKGWITVDAGKSVPLSSPEAVRAQDAFISNYKSNHDYTQ